LYDERRAPTLLSTMTEPPNSDDVKPSKATPRKEDGTPRPNVLLGKLFGRNTSPNNGEPVTTSATKHAADNGHPSKATEMTKEVTKQAATQPHSGGDDREDKETQQDPMISLSPSTTDETCDAEKKEDANDEKIITDGYDTMQTDEETPTPAEDETMEDVTMGTVIHDTSGLATDTASQETSIADETTKYEQKDSDKDEESEPSTSLKEYNLDVRFSVPSTTKKIPVQMVKDLFLAMKDQDPFLQILPFELGSDEYPIQNRNQFPKEDDLDDVRIYFPNLGFNRMRTTVATIMKVSSAYSHVQWRSVLAFYLKRTKVTLKRHVLPTAKTTCVGILVLKHPDFTHLSYYSSYLQDGILCNCPPFEFRVMQPTVRPNLNATVQTKVIGVRSGVDVADEVNQYFMKAFPVNTGDGEFYVSYKAGTEDDMMATIYRKQNKWMNQVQVIPVNVKRNIDETHELGFNRPLSLREFIRDQPGDEFTHPMDIENGGRNGKPVLIVLPQFRALANNVLNDFRDLLRNGRRQDNPNNTATELDDETLSHMSRIEQDYMKRMAVFSQFELDQQTAEPGQELDAPPKRGQKHILPQDNQASSTTSHTTKPTSYAAAAAAPPSPRSQRKQAAHSMTSQSRFSTQRNNHRGGRGGRGGRGQDLHSRDAAQIAHDTGKAGPEGTPTPAKEIRINTTESITSTMTDTRNLDSHTLLLDMHEMLLEQQELLREQRKRQRKLEKEQVRMTAKHGMMRANLSLLLEKLEVFSNSARSLSDLNSLMHSVDDIKSDISSVDDIPSKISSAAPRWSDDEDDEEEVDKASVQFSTNESIIYDPRDMPKEVQSGEHSISAVWNSPSGRHTSSKVPTKNLQSPSISTTNSYDPLWDDDDTDSEPTYEKTSSQASSPLMSLGRTRSRGSPSQDKSPSLRPPPKIPRTSQTRPSYRITAVQQHGSTSTEMEIETEPSSSIGDTTGFSDSKT